MKLKYNKEAPLNEDDESSEKKYLKFKIKFMRAPPSKEGEIQE